jgi:hypothetical protein
MDTEDNKKYLTHDELVRKVTITDDMVYFNEKEAAKFTGKALSTLRNDRNLRRGIPYSKAGGIRYSKSDCIAYMEAQKVTF